MRVIILSSLGNQTAQRCLDSLLSTAPQASFDIHLIRERNFREQTLNFALDSLDSPEDTLFVGDDIIFSDGWYEALQKHQSKADILGMTMIYPETNLVQDRGYDLVNNDGQIPLVAKDRGKNPTGLKPFEFRHCDAVCGCFLFVAKKVLTKINHFNEQGANRWGEFIFICDARKHGFTVGVIEHFLFHGGISTKNNPDKKFSSTSYIIEQKMWNEIVKEHVDPAWIQYEQQSRLAPDLISLLNQPGTHALFYGAGTVSSFILDNMNSDLKANVDFCSGLPEEVGLKFETHTLLDATTVDLTPYNLIVMTPLRIGEGLFEKIIAPRLPQNYSGQVVAIAASDQDGFHEYSAISISL